MKILVGIIILAIVVYAAILIYQQYLLRQIKALVDSQSEIDPAAIQADIAGVKTMSLTGKTLEQVNQLDTDYSDLTENRLPRLTAQLEEARQQAKQYHLFQAAANKNKAAASLRVARQVVKQLGENVDQLQKIDAQHKEAVTALQRRYQELRKALLSKNFLYGDSIDALETQLATLEDNNDTFSALTSQGDHEKATALMEQLQRDTDRLGELIEQIPPLYKMLKEEFPAQIAEIKSGLATLKQEGYQFPESDLDAQVTQLDEDLQAAYEALAKLNLNDATAMSKQLESKADHLYDVMEKEMAAKPKVEANLDVLAKFIAHAKNQNSVLSKELDRLSQNYTLDHDEQATVHDFAGQLKTVEKQYQTDITAIHENQAVYTEVFDRQEQQRADLEAMETQQQAINEAVAGLAEEEKQALKTLQQFDFEMHAIHRQVANLNLPGLAKDYTNYFQVVSTEIGKLNHDINQPRINMEEITKQLIMIQSDLDILKEKTTDLIDSSQLAEQLIQYANRYRMSHDDVAAASDEAQRLFDEDYNYAKSLESIATVLDRVEPGSYKRLEDNYYQSKKQQQDNDPLEGL
ncbi:septation ring formation regulator EzrA [Secundilactobacillus kimchicus]|uniref:septation ring formation regulator EzrA n=1 Tax=Secundilactobacillus kimchicus TaxID=528209 RepID=UPI0024A7C8AD|nr:septation ring formation regulator EzrA [Secundilactobacillus kimchicus]